MAHGNLMLDFYAWSEEQKLCKGAMGESKDDLDDLRRIFYRMDEDDVMSWTDKICTKQML